MFRIYKKEEILGKEWAFKFTIEPSGEMLVSAVDAITGEIVAYLFEVTQEGELKRFSNIDLKGRQPPLKLGSERRIVIDE